MPNRRKFLRTVPALPALGAMAATELGAAESKATGGRDFYKELGVRPFINAAGTYTTLTASLMPPEVVAAYEYASRSYVRLIELHDAVGVKIASMLGIEAAMVTSGAAGALVVGTAACIAGKDPEKILRLPDTTNMKNEVIVQKSHRNGYDHAVRAAGAKMVEVETAAEFESAVGSRTAMAMYFNDATPRGQIQHEQFVALCKKHGVPTINDAAADVPPLENLTKYVNKGFDLVVFSGGKNIRGPQSAGLLLGRRDLIEAARLNTSPYSDTVGRGLKVNKEEILGMMVAVELYLKRDHAADRREGERRCRYVMDTLRGVRSVTGEIRVPPIANNVPHLHIKWDQSKITVDEVVRKLRAGEPSIEVGPGSREELILNFWVAQPGDAEIVAKKLKDLLRVLA